MWPAPEKSEVLTSWTNSDKALVQLLKAPSGEKQILKSYRPGFASVMIREYAAASYAAKRLSIVPRVLGFRPMHRKLLFSFIPGQRVLEWVLERFGDSGLNLSDFHSFHGLNPPHYVDPRVDMAFSRFRESMSQEALQLKQAIKSSYTALHHIGMLHGSADPRNVIYNQGQLFIIDFDHARLSLNPAQLDYVSLTYWYGLQQYR